MPFIDDRGRLFGKINLIDAAVAVLALVLIPVAYGAYRLFRAPAPAIIAVEPSTLVQAKSLNVMVRGRNLRPYLRVFAGPSAAIFLIQDPEHGEVKLPDNLAPGSYDLLFYDEGQLVTKLPSAITIVGPNTTPQPVAAPKTAETLTAMMRIAGVFPGLTSDLAKQLRPGYRFKLPDGAFAEVHSVTSPEVDLIRFAPSDQTPFTIPYEGKLRMKAVLRVRCVIAQYQCRVANEPMHPGLFWSLSVAGQDVTFVEGDLSPEVDTKPPVPTMVEAKVRFVLPAEVFSLVKRGDYCGAWQASLTGVENVRDTATQLSLNQLNGRGGVQGSVVVEQQLKFFDGTVRLAVRDDGTGWVPLGTPLVIPPEGVPSIKAGSTFNFDTNLYTIRGWILGVKTVDATAPPKPTP